MTGVEVDELDERLQGRKELLLILVLDEVFDDLVRQEGQILPSEAVDGHVVVGIKQDVPQINNNNASRALHSPSL